MSREPLTKPIAAEEGYATALRAVSWFGGCIVAATLLALASLELQQLGIAPVVVLPLCIGVLLGVCVVALARLLRITLHRAGWIAVAFTVGLSCVAAEDAIAYVYHRRGYASARERQPRLALVESSVGGFGPPDFVTFWRAQYARTAPWWLVNSAVVISACIATATIAARRFPAFSPPA